MITIILRTIDDSAKEIARIAHKDNHYLEQNEKEYPLLGEVDNCSYAIFSAELMDDLILELTRLECTLDESDAHTHIREIKVLANQCKVIKDGILIFTPFGITSIINDD